jgi:hypothetical protein
MRRVRGTGCGTVPVDIKIMFFSFRIKFNQAKKGLFGRGGREITTDCACLPLLVGAFPRLPNRAVTTFRCLPEEILLCDALR